MICAMLWIYCFAWNIILTYMQKFVCHHAKHADTYTHELSHTSVQWFINYYIENFTMQFTIQFRAKQYNKTKPTWVKEADTLMEWTHMYTQWMVMLHEYSTRYINTVKKLKNLWDSFIREKNKNK